VAVERGSFIRQQPRLSATIPGALTDALAVYPWWARKLRRSAADADHEQIVANRLKGHARVAANDAGRDQSGSGGWGPRPTETSLEADAHVGGESGEGSRSHSDLRTSRGGNGERQDVAMQIRDKRKSEEAE
jgi:hypothetical protein